MIKYITAICFVRISNAQMLFCMSARLSSRAWALLREINITNFLGDSNVKNK